MDFRELKYFLTDKKILMLAGGASLTAVVLGLGYKYLLKPEKVTRVGIVSQLLIHPLKSGKAVSVALAECQEIGLKYGALQDRHWLVVTEDGQMVTGRQQPRLVLVALTVEGQQVCLNAPDMETLTFPVTQPDNAIKDCRVFSVDIQGRDCGEEVSSWLTRYLAAEKAVRMVHFEPQMNPRKPGEKEPLFPQQTKIAYPDLGPIMLLSESSVNDLSSRLDSKVTVARFRPSLVISGCEAFDEDSWDDIQIGKVRLHRVMACGRCIFTTVDPETGVISRKEPLDTLKSYRQCKPDERSIYKTSPLFGQMYTVRKTGVMQVGDVVYKISR
ncbi:mitochondrial amidoxime-reducing component 1-like isoform X1 [Hypomesus transpacificus]|uniref:mitochondrial amidoxime-reducing component 1-like isoform X1 n=1 Tax=Hypomesus transpacificus TaxID=137520 RepID=UPI001F0762FD|nr:mitochondrial amidoxime-reducing component 1-like isoform X1 [Hypomesus transpacificus]